MGSTVPGSAARARSRAGEMLREIRKEADELSANADALLERLR